MKSFEEINELLDKVGERLERTERIVNANSDGYAETKKILKEVAKSNKEFDKRSEEFDKRSEEFDERRKRSDERFERMEKNLEEVGKKLDETAMIVKGNSALHREIDETLEKVGKKLNETAMVVKGNSALHREIDETLEKVGKKLDKTASVVNGIGDSNGIIAEEFFMETTEEGLHVDAFGHLEQKTCNYIVYDSDKNKRAEFDIVFTNDDFIFIVEVKYRLDKKHTACFTERKEKGIDQGLNRLEIFKKYDEKWIGNRTVVTAFACLGARKEVIEAFKEKGYYVLVREPNDTYKLFSPR